MKYRIEYRLGRYQIHINFWYLIIFLVIQSVLNELGFWQLNRAKEKQYRIVQLEKGSASVVSRLDALTTQHIEQFQSVELNLALVGYTTLLLDNKIDNKRPGYHVLNIATESSSGKTVLINRGWVYAGEQREKLPTVEMPNNQWFVSGRVYPLAEQAISTASAAIESTHDYLRLPVLDKNILAEVEKRLDVSLEPYIIRLNSGAQSALKTNWVWTNMSPEKHLAYAIQWFALALAFLVVSLIVCIRKR